MWRERETKEKEEKNPSEKKKSSSKNRMTRKIERKRFGQQVER